MPVILGLSAAKRRRFTGLTGQGVRPPSNKRHAKGIVTRMGRDDRLGERSEYSPVTTSFAMVKNPRRAKLSGTIQGYYRA